VPRPIAQTTRAITIDAPAEEVWRWLMQLGQGRGGLYSYDRLENLANLDVHSAQEIVPELQELEVGDLVRLAPESMGAEAELRGGVRQHQENTGRRGRPRRRRVSEVRLITLFV
jgi:hypothetical protein